MSYAPWRKNWFMAAAWLGLAAIVPAAIWTARGPLWTAGVVSMLCLFLAAQQLRTGQRRAYGKRLESREVGEAVRAFREIPEVSITPSYRIPGRREDIDLLLRKGDVSIPVEIKSFVRWQTYFWRWHGGREHTAITQSKRQQGYVDANIGLIWLPKGRRGFWHRFSANPKVSGSVRLVFGDAEALRRAAIDLFR